MNSLDIQLAQLEQSQLVRRLADEELAYMFKHALTQETACDSLLLKKQREIHRQIAEAYEQLYPERLDEFAAVLAEHYAEAGSDAKTVEYATRAGDTAARVYAQTEAIAQYTRAIRAAQRAGTDLARLADIYTRRGRAFELAGRYGEALANYQELETLARARGDRVQELGAMIQRATVYGVGAAETNWPKAYALSLEALDRARELGSREAEAKALWCLMLANRFGNEGPLKAIEYGEQSAAIARELNLREQLAFALHDLGLTCAAIRQNERGLEILTEVKPLWEILDNKPLLADANGAVGGIYMSQGRFDLALEAGQAAYALDQAIGNQYGLITGAGVLGITYSELGQLDRFMSYVAECEQCAHEVGAWGLLATFRVEVAQVCLEIGDWARAYVLAQQALDFIDKGMPGQHGRALAVIARLHLAQGDLTAAANTLRQLPLAPYMDYVRQFIFGFTPESALVAHAEMALLRGDAAKASDIVDELAAGVESTQTRIYLPTALHLRARVLIAQNRIDKAEAVLLQACDEAEAMQARRRLLPMLITLSEVKAQRNDAEAAESLRIRARQVVDYIAAHSPPDLRAALLSRREIAELMNR